MDFELNKPYLKEYNVRVSDVPTARFITFGEEVDVQKLAGRTLSLENLRFFTEKMIEAFYMKQTPGEPLPEDWDGKPVKVLVKDNFYNVTQDEENDVVVLFHGEW